MSHSYVGTTGAIKSAAIQKFLSQRPIIRGPASSADKLVLPRRFHEHLTYYGSHGGSDSFVYKRHMKRDCGSSPAFVTKVLRGIQRCMLYVPPSMEAHVDPLTGTVTFAIKTNFGLLCSVGGGYALNPPMGTCLVCQSLARILDLDAEGVLSERRSPSLAWSQVSYRLSLNEYNLHRAHCGVPCHVNLVEALHGCCTEVCFAHIPRDLRL